MFNRLLVSRVFVSLFAFSLISSNVLAARADNPFAKNEAIDIGTDSAWSINKEARLATKTKNDGKGSYYHLQFNNKQIELKITKDAAGAVPKEFSQLEIKNVEIDGKQSSLFKWCLKNQERHDRFLQQGLSVKKNICSIDGLSGEFVMRLNKDTLEQLKGGSSLTIMLKPFRTPLVLNYDLGDFSDMYVAMNKKAVPVAAAAPVAAQKAAPVKMCLAEAPAKYKSIKSVEYICSDSAAKTSAEATVAKQVEQVKAKERQIAAEREKQRKLAEEKKKAELAELARQEELRAAEAAAIAASQAKQEQIGGEITEKMVSMCRKFWDKGEHRCYCQKYIEHAPGDIQASSTCD